MKGNENMSGDRNAPVEFLVWLSPGESCTIQNGGKSVVVRFIERKGRRGRIAISATPGGEAGMSSGEVDRDGE